MTASVVSSGASADGVFSDGRGATMGEPMNALPLTEGCVVIRPPA